CISIRMSEPFYSMIADGRKTVLCHLFTDVWLRAFLGSHILCHCRERSSESVMVDIMSTTIYSNLIRLIAGEGIEKMYPDYDDLPLPMLDSETTTEECEGKVMMVSTIEETRQQMERHLEAMVYVAVHDAITKTMGWTDHSFDDCGLIAVRIRVSTPSHSPPSEESER
ncbi:MAG: hypothetical protein KAU47_01365, partial [Candidatus Aminicenantes bacterium]|nr:hypothetical protein [Candidatus Aminicenantes bacterium]